MSDRKLKPLPPDPFRHQDSAIARDDVALPALRLDPDTELARVVPADVEVRQRAVLHDVECR